MHTKAKASTTEPVTPPQNEKTPENDSPSVDFLQIFTIAEEPKSKETLFAFRGDQFWEAIASWAEAHADTLFVSDTREFELEIRDVLGDVKCTATVSLH